MMPAGRIARLLAAWLLGLATGARAQSVPGPATAASAPAPYVDKVIEGLPALADDASASPAYDASGWPRYLRLEGRVGTEPFDARQRSRSGLALQGLIETPNHGALSLEGTTVADERSGSFTLRQRGMPLPGGWWGHHELGVIDRPAPAVTRLPSRVFVPSSAMLGVAGQWDQPEQGWQIQAAHGDAGRLQGIPTALFHRLPGRRSMLGVQASQVPAEPAAAPRGWTGALMLERAEGVTAPAATADQPGIDAQSAQFVLRLDAADQRLQAHLVQTHGGTTAVTRRGAWIDFESDAGPRRHAVGLYRLEAGLAWVDQPLPNDIQGLYYRGSWRTRQWSVEGSVDALQSVSGRASDGMFATGTARWRLSRDHSLGAGLTLRRFSGDAASAYGDWRWQNPIGATGLRLEASHSDETPRSLRLSWDQEWRMPLAHTLSSSLGAARESSTDATGRQAQQLWSAALVWSIPVGAHASARGHLMAEHASSGRRMLGVNLGALWRIAPQWSLEGQYTRSIGRTVLGSTLDPLAPRVVESVANASRSFLVVLRYEMQAGSRSVPIGGRALQGGGRVHGMVYFDANRSEVQEASEGGVPGVLVTLDNRYAVRTDAQGRFEFPFVAAGTHSVAVRNDSLPLPWSAARDGTIKVEVQLRGSTEIAIPVQRAQ